MPERLALGLCLIAAPAVADSFDGTYRQAANADCALVGVDGGAVRIEQGIFYGVENQCRMTRPVNVIDMDAVLYTMQCSGEGTAWSERAMVMRAAGENGDTGDIIMIWDGYAFLYQRCPDP